MKYAELSNNRLFVLIIVLVIISILACFFTEIRTSGNSVFEGMDGGIIQGPSVNILQGPIDGINSLPKRFDHIRDGFNALGRALKDEFVAIGNSLSYMGTDFANIMSGLGTVPPFLGAALKAEAANVKEIADLSNEGIKGWFDAIPTAFDPYLVDSKNHDGVFDRTTRYIRMYSNCGSKFSTNFLQCLIFYIIDVIGNILYIVFVVFPTWIVLVTTKVDITCYYDKFFDAVECIDELWFGMFGFHPFHYTEGIMNMCYYCDGIPHKGPDDRIADPPPKMPEFSPPNFPTAISDAGNKIYNDYHTTIPQRMGAVGRFIGNGRNELKQAGIDLDNPDFDGYKQKADEMTNTFGSAVTDAGNHFSNVIPSQFATANQDFQDMKSDFDAALA